MSLPLHSCRISDLFLRIRFEDPRSQRFENVEIQTASYPKFGHKKFYKRSLRSLMISERHLMVRFWTIRCPSDITRPLKDVSILSGNLVFLHIYAEN